MEIRYDEPKELHIHHVYKVDKTELAKICITTSDGRRPLYWHDGILFLFDTIPMIANAEVVTDFIKGKEHWNEVYYSEMQSYKEYIELEDGDFKGAKVRIMDAGAFSPHKEFVKWVKARK